MQLLCAFVDNGLITITIVMVTTVIVCEYRLLRIVITDTLRISLRIDTYKFILLKASLLTMRRQP